MSAIDRVITSEDTKLFRVRSTLWAGPSRIYDLNPLLSQNLSGIPVYGMNGGRVGTANLVPAIADGGGLMYRMTASIDYHTPDRLAVETGDNLYATMNFVVDTDSPMTSRTLDLCRPIRVNGLVMVTVTLGPATAFDCFSSPWSGRVIEAQDAEESR